MKNIKLLLTGLVLTIASFYINAEANPNPLSVHVLNLQTGLPSSASGIEVKLEQKNGDNWTLLNKEITDKNGRVTALFPTKKVMEQGIYRVTFETGKWFEEHKIETFFPVVPVIFKTDAKMEHYHIPLLISPYGYSTYRGNK